MTDRRVNTFVTISTKTAVTTDKVTLHQAAASVVPADKTYTTQLLKAVIQATNGGTVTIERSGTAPTTTAITPAPVSPGGAAARVTAFGASNVGAGTAIGIAHNLVANVPLEINLEHIVMLGLAATNNVTVSIAITIGNVTTAVYHRENF